MSGSAISHPDDSRWYGVTYQAKRGYVRGALLSRQRPASLVSLYINAAPYVYTGVYIRARPKLTAAILGGLDNGGRIRAIARPVPGASGGAWDLVVFHRRIGYVRAELLSAGPPAPTTTMYVDGGATYPDGVYVRAHPSLNAAVIIGAANGTPVQAVGNPVPGDNGEEWYIVEYQHHIGYARANLLDPAS